MSDGGGSSVTLIYYKIGNQWWKEPFLNVVAAAAQMSALTHVEIAIGGNACFSNHSLYTHTHTHTYTYMQRNRGATA